MEEIKDKFQRLHDCLDKDNDAVKSVLAELYLRIIRSLTIRCL